MTPRQTMMRSRRGACTAGSVFLVAAQLVLGSGCVSAITSAEVMAKVQQRFVGYKSFSARFEKRFVWAALERTSVRHGRIWAQRPSRFRVEMDDGSLIVADGDAIWSYSPRNAQVVVGDYRGGLRTPWEVLLDYKAEYAPLAVKEVNLDRHRCFLLTLKPHSASGDVAQVRVWVDRKKWMVRKVVQREVSGNQTTYVLSDIKVNKKLDDGLFRFLAPPETEIIDQRHEHPSASQSEVR